MEQTYQFNSEVTPVFGFCFFAIFAIIGLAILVVAVMLFCKIFSKAGYSWAMGLLFLVPLGNIIILFILAFGNWPVLDELRRLKHAQMAPPPEGQPHDSFRNV